MKSPPHSALVDVARSMLALAHVARGHGRRWLACACLLAGALLGSLSLPARAETLTAFELSHTGEGVQLEFATVFDLSPAVEQALQKGVALNFVVEARILRERWYWRDQRVARATRLWRLSYQPLTRQYRVGFGGLNQVYDTLPEALSTVQHMAHWKLAEAGDVAPAGKYYVQFTYQLDTSLLPRPMQIGIGGQSDWSLEIQRTQRLPPRAAPEPSPKE